MAFLEVYFPDGRVEHFELNKTVMNIGRSAQADIAIDLPAISRIHARIEKGAKGRWIVTDLDSRNKTYVEGRAVKTHVLSNRDIFYFGSTKIVFQDPTGESDQKTEQTVFREKKRADKAKNPCPLCKAEMPDHAVVCMACGYNTKLGKRMKVQFDENEPGKNTDTSHTAFAITGKAAKADTEDKSASEEAAAPSPKDFIIDWLVPPAMIIVGILLIFKMEGLQGLAAQAILILVESALIFVGCMLAQRFAEFEFNHFASVVLKCVAVASLLGFLDSWSHVSQWGFIVREGLPLLVIFGLMLLLFDIDGYGAMLTVLFLGILRNTLLLYVTKIAYHIGTGSEITSSPTPTPTPSDTLPIFQNILF